MSRFIFSLLIVLCLMISSAFSQEENRKIPTFDDATTVEQVDKELNEFMPKLYNELKKSKGESSEKISQTMTE
ncbi:MAG: hypothetical protein LBP87_15140, partial [Planctomycetaceae bacterium]|nr:hypothetical protein [Planctomycetaceae bacterium]